MRLFGLVVTAAVCLWLAGCARARVTTTIQADGAWVRSVVLSGQEKKEMQVTPTLEDTFVTPSGAGWKSNEEKKSDERTLTFERTLASGASLQGDVAIKGPGPSKLRLTNEVTVTRLGPHRFEYRETLKWKGQPEHMLEIKPETLDEIKSALPKQLATDANARALADKMAELSVPMLFGPGDPLLAMGLLHPDLAVRRAGQRIGDVLQKALEQQFGDQLTPAQRKEVARQQIQQAFSSARMSTSDDGGPPSAKKESGSLTPLMFSVKTPGHIVSSNGELDELSGEVFWALFDAAASAHDVVLTAIVEAP